MLSITETIDGVGTTFRHHPEHAPYRGIWATTAPRTERTVLAGHTGGVNSVCAVRVDGRNLLASASDDRTVRIWDPTTGTEHHTLHGHGSGVLGVCAVRVQGRDLLASASADETVRIWDPTTGQAVHIIPMHHEGLGLVWIDGCLVVGNSGGLLALSIA